MVLGNAVPVNDSNLPDLLNHPDLSTPIDLAWKPIIPFNELNLEPDRRKLVEALAARGMYAKADGASTCGSFFRKILEYSDHWVRAGRTTCHLMSCRNCGRGKMRAHRIYARDPIGYSWAINQPSRYMRLSINYQDACPDKSSYLTRVAKDKRYVVLFRRRLRKQFGKRAGTITSVELDAERKNSVFRLYYVGPALHHNWIRKNWYEIAGPHSESESKGHNLDTSKDALRMTLDSLTGVLMLPAPERAAWEEAFTGFRFTSSSGSLRGSNPERNIEDDYRTKDDPEAPYGRCPCGCNGIIEKSAHHGPLTMAQLTEQFEEVDFGSLWYYGDSSNKSTQDMSWLLEHWIRTHPDEGFPPFQERAGPR